MTSPPVPVSATLELGVQTINRPAEARALIELVDRCGYDSIWVGDHIAFPIPILDPLIPLMQAAIWSPRLKLGTGVYLEKDQQVPWCAEAVMPLLGERA